MAHISQAVLFDPEINLTMLKRMQMARDVAQGLNWLHLGEPLVIHRDIKPSNCFVDRNLHVKLGDFGLSDLREKGEAGRDKGGAKGTPNYTPPVRLGRFQVTFV